MTVKKQHRCLCGHAENKHVENLFDRYYTCIVKGCDCDNWRWDKNIPSQSENKRS